MEYKVESSLWDFPAWSGGKDTLDTLKEKGDCEAVEEFIEECADMNDGLTDTQINDILWFERDWIAYCLGYRDWEAYEEGWSESDLDDAENWFEDAPTAMREDISGLKLSDYEDEEEFDDAVQDWWDDLDDETKVEIYNQND